jgi:hypothetical protein
MPPIIAGYHVHLLLAHGRRFLQENEIDQRVKQSMEPLMRDVIGSISLQTQELGYPRIYN